MPAAVSPPPPARSFTRDDLLRAAGQSPYAFIPLALQALRQHPADHELRFLTAAAFARLMLVTAAREQLALLPPQVAHSGPAAALLAAVAALPDDRLSIETIASTARANLEALATRPRDPVDLRSHFTAWSSAAAEWDWFRARDGHIVRRHRGAGQWRHLADLKSAIAALTLPHALPAHKGAIKPYILEGIDPPWLLERILRETPAQPDGYHARVTIAQEDPIELIDGLAHADLREHLTCSRVRVLVGPGAGEALSADLLSRLDTQLIGPGLSMSTVRTPVRPSVEQSLQLAQRVQLHEQAQLQSRIQAIYGSRDQAWWAARFRDARAEGSAAPLRVLVPTCRYSTYIQHASADLVAACNRLGMQARTLIEPDAHSQFSGVAYLRAIAEFEPDLIVLINYSRANINGAITSTDAPAPAPIIHPNIPYVMWVQDAMPHQLDPRVGAAMTGLDFLAGNLRDELFLHLGYPRSRGLRSPIVASEEKFHDGPCDPHLLALHTCEVAYVSHHSETPEAMHSRKRSEAAGNPMLVSLIDELRPAVWREALSPPQTTKPLLLRLRTLAIDALQHHRGDASDESLISKLLHMYALPIADRLIRHQVLAWAADTASSRGWRMHLYGRGWDKHPTLASCARPELTHGDELRVSYRAARAHLQITAHTVIHQRVIECVLSGGLPLGRLSEDDLSNLEFDAAATIALARRPAHTHDRDHTWPVSGGADVCDPFAHYLNTYRSLGYHIASHPRALAYAALRQRCGLRADEFVWLNSAHLTRQLATHPPGDPVIPDDHSIAWLFGDPAEHLFVDHAALDRLLTRAVEDDAWRRGRIAAMQHRIRDHLTHRAFARRLINFVGAGLAS